MLQLKWSDTRGINVPVLGPVRVGRSSLKASALLTMLGGSLKLRMAWCNLFQLSSTLRFVVISVVAVLPL